MKGISLLGATGSIGTQTIDIIRSNRDQFELVAIAVGKNLELTREIINEFHPKLVSVQNQADAAILQREFAGISKILSGDEGLIDVAVHPDANLFVNAILGSVGLVPTLNAIEAGKTIALANKETLVTAGHIVMARARDRKVPVLPVDSEHSAIFQCLQGERQKNIERLIITASGGSFRDNTREQLLDVTIEEALHHPNWSMGAKITIDSATMMNKGLEVIEAHWLFDQPYDKIDVLLHRESTVHSMVEFHDGSIIAQLGSPDMRIPIQYALTYPERTPTNAARLDLTELGTLHFQKMDFNRYRCLRFAYEAGRRGGTLPVVLNAANEVCVQAFLNGKIKFLEIEDVIEWALENHVPTANPDLDTILSVDQETREIVTKHLVSRFH
ncbi:MULTISPECIES: 1-deoxy-D-xylulose-5-phosphate reductoisomerase [Bacillaceae]|uniref:1-deoxy-D-xylulose 5-phosphate reductoisomerase n=1 Tax=Caldibacillus thermoamylovorans TaxID=35841 RepID=A0A090ITP5_9BACI|nr:MULTISPECIES: 1-deoxy-D-xylulose-5-phosphate reductoisomerase [Bacillaceae]KIO58977.1 1-deoxy-D-xylulose 5-phosphate reductoisomerase [Caldibacillus thermoamylovorans]KIO62562.1 1-deoxy-D-xylulose 5-phosphate reductoisomerase [Caldibacillus thermoamylovorans]KIO71784.1 1-deoxy-D-xylulose 5-phosphate reductoisomerase [Caldibacillus thermoamylovorans]MCM3476433.1 1-deoxy-D-xylulose-5-phosphate reductoisomerase [Caldibacillus thermoamylovorans]MEC5271472.1 1-deoxy-D-xylulose-5-phosphate reduct